MTGLAQSGAQAGLQAITGAGVSSTSTYIALLTADPSGLSTIAALTEVLTTGYSRQLVTWGSASASEPSIISNSNLLTFGPMTANMLLPAQWAALVTVSSGTSGSLNYTWTLQEQQLVLSTEEIAIVAGALIINLG